ncbi:uncharacterized protein [Panulirus ornatus]|uniref:uncharacterized protein isoform X2 n=1 Tax=Panulirus ornatus TaxID=150431 RepID=UPI003A8C0AC0
MIPSVPGFIIMLLLAAASVTQTEIEVPLAEALVDDHYDNTTNVLSPAEELLLAAKAAGYNLTLERLDEAAAATDEEVEEMMPPPVAEAFIGHRRRDNFDIIREQMIGMIFTGKPFPLGSRPRLPPMRPPLNLRSGTAGRFHGPYNPQEVPAPEEILKPLPFVPGPTMVKFPPHHPVQQQTPSAPSRQVPGHRPGFKPPVEDFSNTVGPDFGPVTFNDFGGNFGFNNNFENDFGDFNIQQRPARPPAHRPPSARPPVPRPAARPPLRTAARPRPPRPSRPTHGRPGGFSHVGFGSFGGDSHCIKYTEDICLDTEEYPHEAILSSLVRDPSRADDMVAEVRSQSADELVDGVTAAQESKYNYQHYFGNRRMGTENHAHRDFAQDGGFLCPAEVKYARPKRARNSKGSWKFIVNMDKYTQTIRMEKCMKPGGACSYVSHHYRATCNQIYNYHRLLSWDDSRGLHMDIFKVPSCCSCHIQGYAYIFPPLNRHQDVAGSDQVIRTVPAPSKDVNAVAPVSDAPEQVYRPVNVEPVKPRRRRPDPWRPSARPSHPDRDNTNHDLRSRKQEVKDEEQKSRQEPPVHRIRPLGGPQRPPQANEGDSKVNYGYHPIIDFFSPYAPQSHKK